MDENFGFLLFGKDGPHEITLNIKNFEKKEKKSFIDRLPVDNPEECQLNNTIKDQLDKYKLKGIPASILLINLIIIYDLFVTNCEKKYEKPTEYLNELTIPIDHILKDEELNLEKYNTTKYDPEIFTNIIAETLEIIICRYYSQINWFITNENYKTLTEIVKLIKNNCNTYVKTLNSKTTAELEAIKSAQEKLKKLIQDFWKSVDETAKQYKVFAHKYLDEEVELYQINDIQLRDFIKSDRSVYPDDTKISTEVVKIEEWTPLKDWQDNVKQYQKLDNLFNQIPSGVNLNNESLNDVISKNINYFNGKLEKIKTQLCDSDKAKCDLIESSIDTNEDLIKEPNITLLEFSNKLDSDTQTKPIKKIETFFSKQINDIDNLIPVRIITNFRTFFEGEEYGNPNENFIKILNKPGVNPDEFKTPGDHTSFITLNVDDTKYGPFYNVINGGSGLDINEDVERIFNYYESNKDNKPFKPKHYIYSAYGYSGSGKSYTLLTGQDSIFNRIIQKLNTYGMDKFVIKMVVYDYYGEIEDDKCLNADVEETLTSEIKADTTLFTIKNNQVNYERINNINKGTVTNDYIYKPPINDLLNAANKYIDNINKTREKENFEKDLNKPQKYHVRSTPNNPVSSRAHLFVDMYIVDKNNENSLIGKITLMDMGGSEDVNAIQSDYFTKVEQEVFDPTYIKGYIKNVADILINTINDNVYSDSTPSGISSKLKSGVALSDNIKTTLKAIPYNPPKSTLLNLYIVSNPNNWLKLIYNNKESLLKFIALNNILRIKNSQTNITDTENIINKIIKSNNYKDYTDNNAEYMKYQKAIDIINELLQNKNTGYISDAVLPEIKGAFNKYFPEKIQNIEQDFIKVKTIVYKSNNDIAKKHNLIESQIFKLDPKLSFKDNDITFSINFDTAFINKIFMIKKILENPNKTDIESLINYNNNYITNKNNRIKLCHDNLVVLLKNFNYNLKTVQDNFINIKELLKPLENLPPTTTDLKTLREQYYGENGNIRKGIIKVKEKLIEKQNNINSNIKILKNNIEDINYIINYNNFENIQTILNTNIIKDSIKYIFNLLNDNNNEFFTNIKNTLQKNLDNIIENKTDYRKVKQEIINLSFINTITSDDIIKNINKYISTNISIEPNKPINTYSGTIAGLKDNKIISDDEINLANYLTTGDIDILVKYINNIPTDLTKELEEFDTIIKNIHCPLRYQGNFINKTLFDIKNYAESLAKSQESKTEDFLTKDLMKNNIITNDTFEQKFILMTNIRLDFKDEGNDSRHQNYKNSFIKSLEFAHCINPFKGESDGYYKECPNGENPTPPTAPTQLIPTPPTAPKPLIPTPPTAPKPTPKYNKYKRGGTKIPLL